MLFLGLFTSSWMLLWAIAASIPILLHYLSRRHRKEIRWAAVQFVVAAYQKSFRRFRFWQWLLLALRIIATLLIAFALADPIINASSEKLNHRQPQLHLLVFDSSLSMQTLGDRGSRWSDAVSRANQICDAAEVGDGFLLLQVASTLEWVVDDISFDAVTMKQTLGSLQPLDTEALMNIAIDDISDKLTSFKTEGVWKNAVHVSIFTDLQATSWKSVNQEMKLPSNATLEIVDVSSNQVENSFVHSLSIDQSLFVAEQPLKVHSEISRSAFGNSDSMLVQILIDDVVQESRRIEMSPGDQRRVSWEITVPAGEHRIGVKIPDDALNVDNMRRVAVDMQTIIHAVCIGHDVSSTRFVATALQSGTKNQIDVKEFLASNLTNLETKNDDFMVLCDTGSLSREDTAYLKRFLRQGGNAMMWLGPRCDPESLNRFFTENDNDQNLSMGRIESLAKTDQYSVDPLGYRHPIIKPFQSHPDSGLVTIPVFRYWKLDTANDSTIETVLSINNGDPLIVLKRFASGGSLVVVTTAAYPTADDNDVAWNAMALWPSFIPLVQETVAYIRSPARDRFDLSSRAISVIAGESRGERIRKDDQLLPIDDTAIPTQAFNASWPTRTGFYAITRDNKPLRQIAVNTPLSESDPEIIDIARLPPFFQLNHDVTRQTEMQARTHRVNGFPLFQIILACLIGCLITESYVSRRLTTIN